MAPSTVRGSTAKLQATRESRDGGQLLWFYISKVDEENRGVGFVNH